jgi:hypothetical protein
MFIFHIRQAKPIDADSISTLILAGSEESVGDEGTAEEVDNWRNSVANINIIHKRIAEQNMRLVVAENSSHYTQLGIFGTGFATMNSDGEGFIGGIVVAVSGKDIEHKIMSDLLTWLRNSRVHTVSVSVSHTNTKLKRLVEEFGFKKTGSETGVYFINGDFEVWSAPMNELKELTSQDMN